MNTTAPASPATKPWMLWTGRILSALTVFLLCFAAYMGIKGGPDMTTGMKQFGWSEDSLLVLAVLQLGSALLYAIPRTAVLGAILVTGYFGGAIATHLRVHDHGWPMALLCGIVAWLGLYLRDQRLRALLPLRK